MTLQRLLFSIGALAVAGVSLAAESQWLLPKGIAIVQRIACEAPETAENREQVGGRSRPRATEPLSDRVTALAGCWRITPDFDRLIGSPDRRDGQEFPRWLKLGIALPDAPVLDKETTALLEDKFAWRMGHTILATGYWKIEEESDFASDRDSKCIVTAKDGVTYLWLGTPDKMLFGAEVHFIKGVDRERSLLIFDFSAIFPMRMHNAEQVVAYSGTSELEIPRARTKVRDQSR